MSELAQRLTGSLADRYRIERELGRGGMATVFLAEDLKHSRRVALKVLDPDLGAAIGPGRFVREIETVARLTHPHILPLHDSGAVDGLLYYVMPYVEGESLRARLEREKQLPLEDALRITREVADALGCAHQHGVVHRDIKPENILLESGHAVVADFGIARALSPAGERLTATGGAVGTPAYMSPEQATGSRQLDGRSDLYSLGCVLYEMLAGEPPYTGPTAESVVFQHLNAAPPRVTAMRPSLPAALDEVITRALAKSPADRFATAGDFLAVLGAHATPPGTQAAAPVEAASPRTARLLRLAALAAGGIVLAVAAVLAWRHWAPHPAAEPVRKDLIMVAAFEGPPDDSSLAVASRELFCAALDQSSLVAPVPRDGVAKALKAAGKPPNTRVDAELARELAYRLSVRTVLEGQIGRIGSGYSLVLRLVDADSARTILTETTTAKNADALIPALGDLAKKLRAGLGENRRALAATRSMAMVATPSFEAYKLYVQAIRRTRAGDNVQGKALLRAAIALDPDFAAAWGALRFPYGNLLYPDSVVMVCDEALRRPTRLTDRERFQIQNSRNVADGDWQGALGTIDRALLENPDDTWALAAGNNLLWSFGRYEDALARVRRFKSLQPFGAVDGMYINEGASLTMLGRFDEARTVSDSIQGVWRSYARAWVELYAGNYARAESLGAVMLTDPRTAVENPGGVHQILAWARRARGELAAADSSAARLWSESAGEVQASGDLPHLFREQVTFSALCAGRPVLQSPGLWPDTTAAALLTRGLQAVYLGDLPLARRCLERARRRPRRELVPTGSVPELLEGSLLVASGRWGEAARLLQPIAVRPRWVGQLGFDDLSAIRWTIADAYERLGRPDSAAAHLERITRDPLARCFRPYARLRLAELDARLGRIPDAERHLAEVERAWERPDAEPARRLEQARAAVAAARGMARKG